MWIERECQSGVKFVISNSRARKCSYDLSNEQFRLIYLL